MTRSKNGAFALALALALAACDSSTKPAPASATPDTIAPPAPSVAAAPGEADAPPSPPPGATMPSADVSQAVRQFVKANNAFAFDLYARRRAATGDLALSPASVTTALAMTWAGAKGETADEMKRALHFEADQAGVAAAAGELIGRLNAPGQKVKLRVSNRLFGERSFRFEPPYLALTKSAFGAPLEPLDFAHAPEPSRQRINDWAAKETENRVTNLVPANGVDRETRLVLVNAVYFLGTWSKRFDKAFTSAEPFFANGAGARPAPTMRQTETFGYAASDGVKVLELPYEGGDYALTLLLPERRDGLAALEASLTADKFAAWAAALAPTRVAVALPTFKIEPAASLSLGDDLKALGMKRAFERGRAEFFGIASPPEPADRLFVGAVFHKAFVKVDEAGTEAAAATAVAMPRGGRPPPAAPPVEFRADHPFLFALRDAKTGLLLFVGRVTDPAAP